MPAIQPSGQLLYSEIKSALGTSVNNMGSIRGLNQTLPSSGQINFSNAQKLVKGVGFSTAFYAPVANTIQGYWSDLGYSNTSALTISFQINISATNGSWRSVVHVTTGGDGMRRPSVWIKPGETSFHITSDTSVATNEHADTPGIGLNTTTSVAIVYNGRNRKTYYNGVLQQDINFSGTPTNNSGSEGIYSANPSFGYNVTGGFTMNRLWFFPMPLTQAQVSLLHTTNKITA
jgi:hypothetical protein